MAPQHRPVCTAARMARCRPLRCTATPVSVHAIAMLLTSFKMSAAEWWSKCVKEMLMALPHAKCDRCGARKGSQGLAACPGPETAPQCSDFRQQLRCVGQPCTPVTAPCPSHCSTLRHHPWRDECFTMLIVHADEDFQPGTRAAGSRKSRKAAADSSPQSAPAAEQQNGASDCPRRNTRRQAAAANSASPPAEAATAVDFFMPLAQKKKKMVFDARGVGHFKSLGTSHMRERTCRPCPRNDALNPPRFLACTGGRQGSG